MSPAEPGDRVPGPILIVGTGLVGTSLGLALTAAGHDVRLRDADEGALTVAASRGAGSTAVPASVGCVVVAVPPAQVATVVAAMLAEHRDAVVTDVGSVKSAPLAALTASTASTASTALTVRAGDLARYVGGHPMAGSELSGPWAASAELFQGRAWAVTPHPGSRAQATAAVAALAEAAGAVVVPMTPQEHDLAVAKVSHLPHLLAVLAAARLDGAPPDHLALSGQGLRDVTRVAAGDPGLWGQILAANADAVRDLLRGVRADLDRLLAGLDSELDSELDEVLRRGVRGTRLIPAKHGGPARAEAVVVVTLPDRPGGLARLFADAGESGVNIEDVRIDHDPGRLAGRVELAVQAAAADTLVAALTARGWPAYH